MNLPSGIKFDFIEFLKLAPKYFLPFLILSSVVVFSPSRWLDYLALEAIVQKYKWVFSLIFILSLSMFLSGISIAVYEKINEIILMRSVEKKMKEHLPKLSTIQRDILNDLLDRDLRTIELPMNNGEVNELVKYKIIYRASGVSKGAYYFDYCLQPIAEKVLRKNRDLFPGE